LVVQNSQQHRARHSAVPHCGDRNVYPAFNLPKKAKQIEKQIAEIDEELQNTPNLVNQFNDLSAILTDTQKRWENRNKDIPPVDITSQSYAYFSRLIELSGELKLDMVFAGTSSMPNYGLTPTISAVRRSSRTSNRFVWYLENDRKLYKVKNLNIKGLEIAPTEKEEGKILITFDMAVHAYFSTVAELSSSLGERALTPNGLNVDPFAPVITSGIPPNYRTLVEVERSDLKAVIPGKAFVLDQTNVIRTLREETRSISGT